MHQVAKNKKLIFFFFFFAYAQGAKTHKVMLYTMYFLIYVRNSYEYILGLINHAFHKKIINLI